MHRFSGFSSIVIVIILALISSSLWAISVDKSYRQSQVIINQQHQFDAELQVSNALNQAVYNLIASDSLKDKSAVSPQISSLPVSMARNEHVVDGKSITLFDLSVRNTLSDTVEIEHSVSIRQLRRLERSPVEATEVWSASLVHRLADSFFKLPFDKLTAFRSSASYTATQCDEFPEQVHGFIWIHGDCELDGLDLGTPERPLVLVIEGNIKFSNFTVYGLLIHLCSSTSSSLPSMTLSSFTVDGAVVSSCTDNPAIPLSVTSSVRYNPYILDVLVNHPDNTVTKVIKGSWQYQ